MPAIRSSADIAAKWARVTQTRQADYQAGVNSPRNDWASQTVAAANSWAQGVQEAITSGRFANGVNNAGTQKWKANTLNLGVNRWPQGVANAQPSYQKGFDKFAQVINSTTLPPRGPKGSPQNIQRVQVMAAALHNAKVGM